MANFPTLQRRGTETHNPVIGELSNELAHDPTIRSSSEGGYVTSRARFTRMTNRWNVMYRWLSQANKNTLKAFVEGNADSVPVGVAGGSDSFDWINPEDSVTYNVRFLGEVKYTPHDKANALWWIVEFILEEV